MSTPKSGNAPRIGESITTAGGRTASTLAILLTSSDPEMVAIGKKLVIDPASPSGLAWKVSYPQKHIKPGDTAGYLNKALGYWAVTVNRKKYIAHRVVWLLATGAWPSEQIDHINEVKSDNRIDNLREVTHSENQQNIRRARKNNLSSIYRGVSWDKGKGKWRAAIRIPGINKQKRIGFFNCEYQAHLAYESERAKVHPFSHAATKAREEAGQEVSL